MSASPHLATARLALLLVAGLSSSPCPRPGFCEPILVCRPEIGAQVDFHLRRITILTSKVSVPPGDDDADAILALGEPAVSCLIDRIDDMTPSGVMLFGDWRIGNLATDLLTRRCKPDEERYFPPLPPMPEDMFWVAYDELYGVNELLKRRWRRLHREGGCVRPRMP